MYSMTKGEKEDEGLSLYELCFNKDELLDFSEIITNKSF